MATLVDYIKWREDLTFESSPINCIDSLIFTELSYLPFEDIVSSFDSEEKVTVAEIGEKFFSLHDENMSIGAIIPSKEIIGLLKQIMTTERYKNVKAWGYVNHVDIKEEKQFSAICFDFSDKLTYVAYRGTDDTIIGWKENFNMALYTPVSAQHEGYEYLEKVASLTKNKLYIGGHSKGGNLAIYSAVTANSKIEKRIVFAHSFDGPGFRKEFIEQIKDKPVLDKITTYIPEASTVGMIFDAIGEIKPVKSSTKGLRQHDAFSWNVMKTDFVGVEKFKKSSLEFHTQLINWVDDLTREEIIDFTETLYKICTFNEASTLTEIGADKMKFVMGIIKADRKSKKIITSTISKFIKKKHNRPEKSKKTVKKKEK